MSNNLWLPVRQLANALHHPGQIRKSGDRLYDLLAHFGNKENSPTEIVVWTLPSGRHVLVCGHAKVLELANRHAKEPEKRVQVDHLNPSLIELMETELFAEEEITEFREWMAPENWSVKERHFSASLHMLYHLKGPKWESFSNTRKHFADLYGCADGSLGPMKQLLQSKHSARADLTWLVVRGFVTAEKANEMTLLNPNRLDGLMEAAKLVATFNTADLPDDGTSNVQHELTNLEPEIEKERAKLVKAARKKKAREQKSGADTDFSNAHRGLSLKKLGQLLDELSCKIHELASGISTCLLKPDGQLRESIGRISPVSQFRLFCALKLLELAGDELQSGSPVEPCHDHDGSDCTNCDCDGWHSADSHQKLIADMLRPRSVKDPSESDENTPLGKTDEDDDDALGVPAPVG